MPVHSSSVNFGSDRMPLDPPKGFPSPRKYSFLAGS